MSGSRDKGHIGPQVPGTHWFEERAQEYTRASGTKSVSASTAENTAGRTDVNRKLQCWSSLRDTTKELGFTMMNPHWCHGEFEPCPSRIWAAPVLCKPFPCGKAVRPPSCCQSWIGRHVYCREGPLRLGWPVVKSRQHSDAIGLVRSRSCWNWIRWHSIVVISVVLSPWEQVTRHCWDLGHIGVGTGDMVSSRSAYGSVRSMPSVHGSARSVLSTHGSGYNIS